MTRKLKYKGDREIRIRHASPLISFVVEPKEPKDPLEGFHMFDSIGLTTTFRPNETIVYGEPVRLKSSRGDAISVIGEFRI
jgi:hypothetical protein